MLTARRRRAEDGQALIFAVAFLGMFGLLTTAVLGFAAIVQKQRGLTEHTALVDSVTDGAAQFAMADTGIQGCGTVISGIMKFPNGDGLTYLAGAGACTSASSTVPGQSCGLCVLNYGNVNAPLNIQKGDWTVPGQVDVNGSISLIKLTAGTIGLHGSGTTCGSTCTPAATHLSATVDDPLAGALPVPTLGTNQGSRSGNTIVCPGTYTNLSAGGNGQILFLSAWGQNGCGSSSAPSLFIVTGSLSLSGKGSIVAANATIYLTSSASLDATGQGDVSIDCGGTPTSTACGTADTPTTGPYAGVAIFVDPANSSTFSLSGQGNFTVAGTFEASHASISMGGNGGSQSFQSGRLIISEISGSGNGGAGLGFTGTINASGCNYWSDTLTGTPSGGISQAGHVRFESACNVGSPTAIVSYSYG